MPVVARKLPPKRLPPGTTLHVQVGSRTVVATVVEDLGPMRPDGKHLVRLRGTLESGAEPSEFDLSLDVEDLPL